MKTYFPNDELKNAMFVIIVADLKKHWNSWVYILEGSKETCFLNTPELEAKKTVVKFVTGQSVEDFMEQIDQL
jgi:hypothetical protein